MDATDLPNALDKRDRFLYTATESPKPFLVWAGGAVTTCTKRTDAARAMHSDTKLTTMTKTLINLLVSIVLERTTSASWSEIAALWCLLRSRPHIPIIRIAWLTLEDLKCIRPVDPRFLEITWGLSEPRTSPTVETRNFSRLQQF